MYAVIKSGGRQYQVAPGETLEVNRLAVEPGEQVRFEEVVLISNGGETLIGTPHVEGAVVLATATELGRGEKLIVFKYKSKKRYRHKRGHRQELTFLSIDDIVTGGKSLITGEAPKAKAVEVEIETPEAVVETPLAEEDVTTTSATASEAPAEPTGEKKTRRRRTTQAEDSASKAEEE
jgi:large subunit ribosomal protein L21